MQPSKMLNVISWSWAAALISGVEPKYSSDWEQLFDPLFNYLRFWWSCFLICFTIFAKILCRFPFFFLIFFSILCVTVSGLRTKKAWLDYYEIKIAFKAIIKKSSLYQHWESIIACTLLWTYVKDNQLLNSNLS